MLYFGCRHPDQDFLYQDELEGHAANGVADLRVAFSRKEKAKTYVQDLVREDRDKPVVDDRGGGEYLHLRRWRPDGAGCAPRPVAHLFRGKGCQGRKPPTPGSTSWSPKGAITWMCGCRTDALLNSHEVPKALSIRSGLLLCAKGEGRPMPMLHMIEGPVGAGKTTYANRLGRKLGAAPLVSRRLDGDVLFRPDRPDGGYLGTGTGSANGVASSKSGGWRGRRLALDARMRLSNLALCGQEQRLAFL